MPPVVGAVGAVFTSAGALAASAVGIGTAAAWTSAFAQIAVGSALSIASRAIMAEKMPRRSQGVRTGLQAGEAGPFAFIVGRYATAGTLIYENSHNRDSKTPNNYLTQVILLSDMPATLTRVRVDGAWRALGVTDPALGRAVSGFQNRRGKNRLWVRIVSDTGAADPYLLATYGGDANKPWTADMHGRGATYAVVTAIADDAIWRAVPRLLFELDGLPLYDPRKDSTAGGSGSQRRSQPSTWLRAGNPKVIEYNILLGIRDPATGEQVWGGQDITQADLPAAEWFAAMNECDRAVDKPGGGTEPQFRAGLEISLTDEPAAACVELNIACLGQTAPVGGIWHTRAGPPGLPVWAFSDEDVVVTSPEEFDPFPGINEMFNGVVGSYPDPDSGYAPKDAPAVDDADYLAADDGRRNVIPLRFPAVVSATQVQRLMRPALDDSRRARRHLPLPLPPEARILGPLDVVQWTSSRNGYPAKLFEITMAEDLPNGLTIVAAREIDPEDYVVPGGVLVPPPGRFDNVVPLVPTITDTFSVEGATVQDASGIGRRAAIRLNWAVETGVDAVRYRVRLAATQEHVPSSGEAATPDTVTGSLNLVLNGQPGKLNGEPLSFTTVTNVAQGFTFITAGILPLTAYEVQAIYVPTRGRRWSVWLPVTTPDVRLGEADLADIINNKIDTATTNAADAAAEATAALAAVNNLSSEALADIAALTAALEGLETGEITALTGVAIAGASRGWVVDPIFWNWGAGVPTKWNTTGVATLGSRGAGFYGAGIVVEALNGSGLVQVVATSETAGQIAADVAAEYVVVSILYEFISGAGLGGCRLRPEWRIGGSWVRGAAFGVSTAVGNLETQWGLSERVGAFQSREVIWRKPTGTATAVQVVVNLHSASGPAISHRVDVINIRAASDAEIAAFNAAPSASVTSLEASVASVEGAVAAINTTVNATFGSMSAFVQQMALAKATTDRVSAVTLLRAVAGGASAGITLAAWDGASGIGSAIVLDGQNVIAPGSLSAGEIVIQNHGYNEVPDNDLQSQTAWSNIGAEWSIRPSATREESESEGELRWSLTSGSGNALSDSRPFRVRPGEKLTCRFQCGALSTGGQIFATGRIRFGDADGNLIPGDSVIATNDSGSTFPRAYERVITVPPNARRAVFRFQVDRAATTRGVRFFGPSVIRQTNASALITPDGAFFNEMTAREAWVKTLNVEDLFAVRAKIGNGAVTNQFSSPNAGIFTISCAGGEVLVVAPVSHQASAGVNQQVRVQVEIQYRRGTSGSWLIAGAAASPAVGSNSDFSWAATRLEAAVFSSQPGTYQVRRVRKQATASYPGDIPSPAGEVQVSGRIFTIEAAK